MFVEGFLNHLDELDLDELERAAREATAPEMRKFYYVLFELVLDKKQMEVISRPGFEV